MSVHQFFHPDPRDPPRRYPSSEPSGVLEQLASTDEEVSKELLREAETLYAEPESRVASVDRRAATLQGAVAIAATVTLTGGGLLLDHAKIPDENWRLALATGLGALLLMLLLAGWRATSPPSRIFEFRPPAAPTLAQRASQPDAITYRRHRAAYLLWAYGRNSAIADVKVQYLHKAAFWFRTALVVLAVVM